MKKGQNHPTWIHIGCTFVLISVTHKMTARSYSQEVTSKIEHEILERE